MTGTEIGAREMQLQGEEKSSHYGLTKEVAWMTNKVIQVEVSDTRM